MSTTALRSAAVVLAMFHIASGSACIHPKFRLAAQTIKGSGQTVSTIGSKNITEQLPEYSASIDYENLTWVEHQHSVSDGIDVKQDTIMNWKTGILAQRLSQSNGSSFCEISEFPWMIRGLDKRITEMILHMTYDLLKCVGHHDNLDEYGFRMAFHPKGPLAKLVGTGSFDLSTQMDLDASGVFKKVSTHARINTVAENSETLATMTFTEGRAGGPSEEDLKVPDAWNCKKSPSREAKDILVDWLRSDSPFKGHARIIPYAILAVMSEADSAFVV